MLDQFTNAEKAMLVNGMVNQGKMQPVLYKYRSFDANTDSTFNDGKLYFSTADKFNDPFDCRIHDAGGYTSADILDYLTRNKVDGPDAATIILKNNERSA